MFCPKCGKINPDTETLCSGCGAQLKEETAPVPAKKGKALKLSLTLIVLIVAVVIVVLLLNGCNAPTEDMSF